MVKMKTFNIKSTLIILSILTLVGVTVYVNSQRPNPFFFYVLGIPVFILCLILSINNKEH